MNEWPGGAQQIAREAARPLTRALLKQVHAPTKNKEQADLRLPPTIKEQDIWDFDGSSLITAEDPFPWPSGMIKDSAFFFPIFYD